jgi:hypothetical protein
MPIPISTLNSGLKSPSQVWATWLRHNYKTITNISFNAYFKKSNACRKKHEQRKCITMLKMEIKETYYYDQNGNQGDQLLLVS